MRLVCRRCELDKCAERYQKTRETIIAKQREDRQSDPEKYRQRDRERYRTNPNRRWTNRKNKEHSLAVAREWKRNHPDWQKRHPETNRASSAGRRARVLAAGGSFNRKDVELQRKAQTSSKGVLICWWCDKPIKGQYHIDHRVPLVKGGTNDPKNLCLACPDCNRKKGKKLPSEWIGRLL
jgi:5-methylcytosine-specific restriction endonuclease McrA